MHAKHAQTLFAAGASRHNNSKLRNGAGGHQPGDAGVRTRNASTEAFQAIRDSLHRFLPKVQPRICALRRLCLEGEFTDN